MNFSKIHIALSLVKMPCQMDVAPWNYKGQSPSVFLNIELNIELESIQVEWGIEHLKVLGQKEFSA